jgi:hypothetical protein
MPDQIPSFEQTIESDLRRLATEIQKNRENPELTNAGEKEVIKEAIRAFPPVYQSLAAQSPSLAQPRSTNPLPDYAQSASPEAKLEIEYLLDLALKQGIGKALTESHKSPYFVQDAFHDALAGRLYPELQKRGIVK